MIAMITFATEEQATALATLPALAAGNAVVAGVDVALGQAALAELAKLPATDDGYYDGNCVHLAGEAFPVTRIA